MIATEIRYIRLSQLEPVALDGLLHRATWASIDDYSTEGAICGVNPAMWDRRTGSESLCPACNFRARMAKRRGEVMT